MAERYEIELFVSFSCIFIYLFDLEKVVGRFKKKKRRFEKIKAWRYSSAFYFGFD